MITIDDEQRAVKDIKSTAEQYAKEQNLCSRDMMHMNLAMEEMMEISRISGNTSDRCITIDGNGPLCILTLELSPGTSHDISFKNLSGVSQKIKVLLGTNYETIELNEKEASDIGIRRADKKSLSEMDCDSVSDAYLWTIESYNLASYKRYLDGDEKDWIELPTSILSALAKDIRIFILKGCILFSIILVFDSKKGEIKKEIRINEDSYKQKEN
ncbi:hypothetical protein [Oribacterium sp. P6A1]|uniref:hypothetical protein n=1 Tax=Oribacterium sp. P6A1 TaxID=1410612 RepID=UPI000559BD0E|nr:hypothetical protein [Oribacterium sp. P6A1]